MTSASSTNPPRPFAWPRGKRAAVSLSFDDARYSQVDRGVGVLDRHGVRATFYVCVKPLDERLDAWKTAAARGHEIGNHTITHPCTGNFPWSRGKALEDYTLERMEADLTDANREIHRRLGITPTTFAYPCGQTFIGRGRECRSYVPLVARHFLAGRCFLNEYVNDPAYTDLAQVGAFNFDRTPFDELRGLIAQAVESGGWIVFAGHDVADDGRRQAVTPAVLDELCRYCLDPASGVWIDTIDAVAQHVRAARAD